MTPLRSSQSLKELDSNQLSDSAGALFDFGGDIAKAAFAGTDHAARRIAHTFVEQLSIQITSLRNRILGILERDLEQLADLVVAVDVCLLLTCSSMVRVKL